MIGRVFYIRLFIRLNEMRYSWYETGNRNTVLSPAVCVKASDYLEWSLKCLAFRNWDLASCLHFFFFAVNSVSRIGCIEKETGPKSSFFKDIFGISSVHEWGWSIQQTFPYNCRNEKKIGKRKMESSSSRWEEPEKMVSKAKMSKRREKRRWIRRSAMEEKKCIWSRQIWCRRLYGL